MIKEILVVPRSVVVAVVKEKVPFLKKSWALISIHTCPKEELIKEEDRPALKDAWCEDYISLCFGDFTTEKWENLQKYGQDVLSKIPGTRLFSESDAEKIIAYVNKINEDIYTTLVVHCDAGISRSGAVGLFISRYLGLEESFFRKLNPYIYPNMFIYDILSNKAGLKDSYIQWWHDSGTLDKGIWRF